MSATNTPNGLPDVTQQSNTGLQGTLNWVGMSEIGIPVLLPNPEGRTVQTLAYVQAYVNLIDPASKGIHMSRLYVALNTLLERHELTPRLMSDITTRFIETHENLSNAAYLECRFDYFERRHSLKSNNSGWKSYPVRVRACLREGQFSCEIEINVPYSSTCPQSAALSRQLIQDGFREAFGTDHAVDSEAVHRWLGTTEGIRATPHSQRSMAQIKVKLAGGENRLPLTDLINTAENALKTPVQAAVKREDEQEFARLNAANLMFCEDAARRLKQTFSEETAIQDFWIRVNHLESLHAHDAVAIVTKGIVGGYQDAVGEYIGN